VYPKGGGQGGGGSRVERLNAGEVKPITTIGWGKRKYKKTKDNGGENGPQFCRLLRG